MKKWVMAACRRSGRWVLPSVVLGFLLAAGSARASHIADHLLITEVGYDTEMESSTTGYSEFVEIFNPTGQPVELNRGAEPGSANGLGSYFLSDTQSAYYEVVNGPVDMGSAANSDSVLQFPPGAVIPPRGTVVVTADSDAFLAEFFGGDYAAFQGLPGSPQLFEAHQDGDADGVPDMLIRSNSTSVQPWNLTNSGEPVVLFYWDGESDLVRDVDFITWEKTSYMLNKTGVSIDGPDADQDASAYLEDAGSGTYLPEARNGTAQRTTILEPGESDQEGNGLTGHDESSESFDSAAGATWVGPDQAGATPGRQYLAVDGSLGDVLGFLVPAAVSPADTLDDGIGPADYGLDGTLTELYVYPLDTDGDFVPDTLYLAVRGALFSDGSANATFVLIDIDPGSTTGATALAGAGTDLLDESGSLDYRLTHAGFALSTELESMIGFDCAVGLDSADHTDDTGGWRCFGSGGAPGATDDFAWIGTPGDVLFDGDVYPEYPGAPGTTIAASTGFEAWVPFTAISSETPHRLYIAAVTTADTPGFASPNTLPESAGDALDEYPQVIDLGVCFDPATGDVVSSYLDQDGDGVGSTPACGEGIPLVSLGGDCDDADPEVAPGIEESCDGKDNDCDGSVDEDVALTFYADTDGDGYGDPAVSTEACDAPAGFVDNPDDCDDTNADTNPGAGEVCDGVDNDCDAQVDEDAGLTFYLDADADGYGVETDTVVGCEPPLGYVADAGDCDDTDPGISPVAEETCDGIDNNCDGAVDEGVAQPFWLDADQDGFGDPATGTEACDIPGDGYVGNGDDCDDTDPAINPSAEEVCDGIDNDCDGTPDDGLLDLMLYADSDGDGFGTGPAHPACEPQDGMAELSGDCDDADPTTYPTAAELCDGKRNDCRYVAQGVPEDEQDADGDGVPPCLQDCDDADPAVNPSAEEVCDGIDNDCDGATDENGPNTFYADQDGDGHGAGEPFNGCDILEGWAESGDDCDDADPATYPGADEACDGKDNACSGTLPEDEADEDGDGFMPCSDDCDDQNADVYPGASEVCDGADTDCDGTLPEDEMDADGDGEWPCAGDCDDTAPDVSSSGPEICDDVPPDTPPENRVDNDCNPETDETADADGDGYSLCDGDCDDADPAVNPSAPEVCDGDTPVDNDCDPETDETADADGDGYTLCDGDCDDADPGIYPEAEEICGNGVDEDCDGTDPACTPVPTPTATPAIPTPTAAPPTPTLPPTATPAITPWAATPTLVGDDDASAGDDDSPEPTATPEEPGGCACTNTGSRAPGSGGLAIALAGFGLLLARRRRL